MKPSEARVGIAIARGSDPIAGSVTLPDGSESPFCGYLELIAALERVRAAEEALGIDPSPGAGEDLRPAGPRG